jgi:hypothetical protein
MITDGTWEFSTGDPDKRNYGIYSSEGGRIAEVLDQNSDNARLIAAAPELLTACKWLQDTMDKDSNIWLAIREHEESSEWAKGLKGAVAKAENS